MKRMKTLFLYFFGIVGFIIFSLIMEDALVRGMYKKVKQVGADIDPAYGIVMEDVKVDATSMNGNMSFTVRNNTDQNSKPGFMKIDLISDRDNSVITEYVRVPELKPGESKDYQIKFKGNNIKSYSVAMQDKAPNRDHIVDIFGWQFDSRNIFGIDFSKLKIMGVPFEDLFSIDGLMSGGKKVLAYTLGFLDQLPWWAYAAGAFIVYVHLPAGYILGII